MKNTGGKMSGAALAAAMLVLFTAQGALAGAGVKYFASAKYGKYSSIAGIGEVTKDNAMKAGGYEFGYDKSGRTASVRYFENGKPASDPYFGVATIAFKYEGGFEIRNYYGDDGKPAREILGLTNRRMKVDGDSAVYYGVNDDNSMAQAKGGYYQTVLHFSDGLVTKITFLDDKGAAMGDNDGIWEWIYYYDDKGRRVKEQSFDAKGAMKDDSDGIAEIRTEYDADGGARTFYFDTSGNEALKKGRVKGYYKASDSKGRILKGEYYGEDGKLAFPAKGKDLDDFGMTLRQYTYTDGGKLVNNDKGFAEVRYKYDNKHRGISEKYFDENGKPVVYRVNGSCGFLRAYDDRDNKIREESLGENGKPEFNDVLAFCVREYSFDSGNKMTEIRFLDGNNKPMENPMRYNAVKVKIVYDPDKQTQEAVFMSKKGFEIKREYMGMYTEIKMHIQNDLK